MFLQNNTWVEAVKELLDKYSRHIHTHFVLNTVNIETGKKWRQSRKELEELVLVV